MKRPIHVMAVACIAIGAAACMADVWLRCKGLETSAWMLGISALLLGSALELICVELKRICDRLDR